MGWLVALCFFGPAAQGQAGDAPPRPAAGARVLTSFEDIWHLSAAEQQQWQPVRLEYLIYYYDPLWQAMWGRSGETESYLSLGTKAFPLQPGQRVQVEGLMRPAQGMRVFEPKVTVLEAAVPLTPVATRGEVGNTERFNKRLVTIEGLVDRQVTRDANHAEIYLVTEGRTVLVQLLLRNDSPSPQLRDQLIRASGVYFARSEEEGAKIEIWVQRLEDIAAIGSIERDERFTRPLTPVDQLATAAPDDWVHVAGTVQAQQPGKTVTLADHGVEVVLQTAQTKALRLGDQVEAIGFPASEGGRPVLRQSLFRPAQTVFTTIAPLWALSETERQKWQRVRLDFLVYYFDPVWRSMWGRAGGSEDYLSLGSKPFPLRPGQRVLIEGSVMLAGAQQLEVTDPKVTILEESAPLVPVETKGRITSTDVLDKRFVAAEGYVDRQIRSDERHVELDLVIEGRLVVGRLFLKEGETPPDWEGAVVRVQGVYSATQDPTGGAPTIELWIGDSSLVERRGQLDADPRFSLAETPVEKLGAVPPGAMVRLRGVVRAQRPGRTLTLRDETGQVRIMTPQVRTVPLGEVIEAIGVPVLEGAEWVLREALFRKSPAALPPPAEGLPKLRLADQLRELTAEEAARGYPVQLSGLVTWTRPNADFFYILDATGGVRVLRPPEFTGQLVVGTKVEVTGVSASGRFTPAVLASAVQMFSRVEPPEPRLITLEQALTGIEEGQWVRLSGYVRAAEPDGPWVRLELTTSAGEFQAIVPPNERWARLPGAVVQVRGICTAVANSKRQLVGIQIWVASSRHVEVEEAAPENPFAVETRAITSLRQFSSLQTLNRRVRVSGIVVHHEPGRLVRLQEGAEGLLVLSRGTAPLQPGDRIEAVGFPGRQNNRVVLREAVYRRIATGGEPAPLVLEHLDPIDPELDGRLVRVRSVLLDVSTHGGGLGLLNQRDDLVFEAQLNVRAPAAADDWVAGSEVALTGVYELQVDEYRRPQGVRLQLRSAADVQVLRRPSWWTMQRVLAVTGLFAVLGLLGVGWAMALGRRVRQQTGVIREQLEKEKAARLEAALARASKLESLGVLAGGIAHDFNNLLTVIIGNVSLAKLDEAVGPDTVHCLTESERAALRARDLTQQLLTFAKGGEPMRTATRLPDVVREAAQFALHGSKVRSELEIAPDLWPADVDKGQIAQVVHNIIINAAQAMPLGGTVRMQLHNEVLAEPRGALAAGRYVRLSFTDTGAGISPENLTRIFEPYFTTKTKGTGLGLATVYSIVKKHQGHIEAVSAEGRGATFRVWLPAAAGGPEAMAAAPAAPVARKGRVLLMDDEDSIRMLGGAVLRRMGFEVTAVSDGAAVVSEYAAGSGSGRPYDLVILDLTVPGGMGGAEAMERLRAIDPAVLAIVSSGYSSDPVMANYQAHGFRGRVPKPYAAEDLIKVVATVLREGRPDLAFGADPGAQTRR